MRWFAASWIVVLLVAAVPVQAQEVGREQRFEGFFRCPASAPGSPPRCLVAEEFRNETEIALDPDWERLEVELTWTSNADSGLPSLRLVIRGDRWLATLAKSGSAGLVELNLTRSANQTANGTAPSGERALLNISVLKVSQGSIPRAYNQSFNVTIRQIASRAAEKPATVGPTADGNIDSPADEPFPEPERIRSASLVAAPSTGSSDRIIDLVGSEIVLRGVGPLALLALFVRLRVELGLASWWVWRLFARQPPERLLEHPRRRLLMDLVERHPGIQARDLQAASELANGPFRFHLQLLVRHGFIRKEPAGRHVRLFARGTTGDNKVAIDVAARLLQLIQAQPGLAQVELALELAVPLKTVHYHVTLWRRRGRLRLVPDGRASRVYWIA